MSRWSRTSPLVLLLAASAFAGTDTPETQTPFYFDFWNFTGQKPIVSEPWNLPAAAEDARADWPAALQALPGDWKTFGGMLQQIADADQSPRGGNELWHVAGLRRDQGRLTASQEARLDVFYSKSKFDLPDPDYLRWNPYSGRGWKAEEELKVPIPVADSFFLFGSIDGSGDSFSQESVTMTSKAGVGWKWSPLPRSEVQLRGGRMTTYSDLYFPGRTAERSQVMVELMAKVPLFGSLQLQYKGKAVPALVA